MTLRAQKVRQVETVPAGCPAPPFHPQELTALGTVLLELSKKSKFEMFSINLPQAISIATWGPGS